MQLPETLIIATFVVVCIAAFSAFRCHDAVRLARLERKVDAIIKHMHIALPEAGADLSEDVRRLADAGEKIQAIAQHRKDTGAGLKEAKDAVEGYQHRA